MGKATTPDFGYVPRPENVELGGWLLFWPMPSAFRYDDDDAPAYACAHYASEEDCWVQAEHDVKRGKTVSAICKAPPTKGWNEVLDPGDLEVIADSVAILKRVG